MRFLLYFLIVLFYINNLNAQNIKWFWNYEAGLKEAKLKHKNIILFLIKKNSSKIQKMYVDIFQDKNISTYINKNFICIISIFEGKNSYPIELFYSVEFPSIFFVSYKDEKYLLKPLKGDITKQDIKSSLKILQH
jgi:thioredoxin-related protein